MYVVLSFYKAREVCFPVPVFCWINAWRITSEMSHYHAFLYRKCLTWTLKSRRKPWRLIWTSADASTSQPSCVTWHSRGTQKTWAWYCTAAHPELLPSRKGYGNLLSIDSSDTFQFTGTLCKFGAQIWFAVHGVYITAYHAIWIFQQSESVCVCVVVDGGM